MNIEQKISPIININLNVMKTTKSLKIIGKIGLEVHIADNMATFSLLSQQLGMEMQPTPSDHSEGRGVRQPLLVDILGSLTDQDSWTIGGQ